MLPKRRSPQAHRIDGATDQLHPRQRTEADHFGIQTNGARRLRPDGDGKLLHRMRAVTATTEGYGPYKAPDFLLDHPVTSTRISDARARGKSKARQSPAAVYQQRPTALLLPANLSVRNVANAG